jgi:hypothetical protein
MKKRFGFKALMAVVAMASALGSAAGPVSAASYNNDAPEMGVALSKIEDDTDTTNSTWELQTQPGKTLKGTVTVQNSSSSTATYKVSIQQARTNARVNIEYASGDNNSSLNQNMNINSIVKVDGQNSKSIKVAPKSTVDIPVTVSLPAQQFDGYVLGAVVVKKDLPKGYKVAGGYANQFAYVKTIQISESDTHPLADLTSTEKGKVAVRAGQQVFHLGIQNNVPGYISDMTLKTRISSEKSGQIVLSDTQTGRSVAPNSSFDYTLASKSVLPAGKYHYQVKFTNNKTGNTWVFSGEYTISQASFANVSIGRSLSFVPTWLWGVFALLLVLISLLFFLLWKRRKHDDDEEGTDLHHESAE